jgi:hypothetical protein
VLLDEGFQKTAVGLADSQVRWVCRFHT